MDYTKYQIMLTIFVDYIIVIKIMFTIFVYRYMKLCQLFSRSTVILNYAYYFHGVKLYQIMLTIFMEYSYTKLCCYLYGVYLH